MALEMSNEEMLSNSLSHVPIEVNVSVGKAKPMVQELLNFQKGTVLALDKSVDDPVELYVGNRLVGIGTLEVLDQDGTEILAVRIVEVLPVQVAK